MQTEIQVKEDQSIIQESNSIVEQSEVYEIKDAMTCQQAVDFAIVIKEFIDTKGSYHDKEIDMANKLHKSLCAKKRDIVDGPKRAYKLLKDKVALWQHNQELKRQEAIRRAENEARIKEAEKQAAIQKKIDEENRKIEEKRQAEEFERRKEQKRINAQKDKLKAEQMQREADSRRREEEAQREQDRINAEERKAALEEKKQEVYVPTKMVQPVQTISNASVRFEYGIQIIAKKLIPLEYLEPNLKVLKAMAKSSKGTMNIPGVRVTKTPIGSIRK